MSLLDPIKCDKCGNDDQGTMWSVPSPASGNPRRDGRVLVVLKGWRCEKCGHVTPEPKRE